MDNSAKNQLKQKELNKCKIKAIRKDIRLHNTKVIEKTIKENKDLIVFKR